MKTCSLWYDGRAAEYDGAKGHDYPVLLNVKR